MTCTIITDTSFMNSNSTDPEFEWGQKRICNIYKPFIPNPVMATFVPNREIEVIVVDSGIMKNHQEFANAKIEDLYFVPGFGSTNDDMGHGTAVTSLIVGNTIGVNKNVTIKVVKVMGTNYTTTAADIYTALDAVLAYHVSKPDTMKVVLNSWQTANDPVIAAKFTAMNDAGLCVIAAAGNVTENIDDVVPAGVSGVFTVAASKEDDTELVAIYGVNKKLDIYAPGDNISTASIAGIDQYTSGSGSSLAAAFAAGVASIIGGIAEDVLSNNDVKTIMRKDGTFGALIVNNKVSMRENVLLHRPDATTIIPDVNYYVGESTIGEAISLRIYLVQLLPVYSHRTAFGNINYTFNWNDDSSAFANSFTITNDEVMLTLPTDFKLPAGEDIKQYSFSVTATGGGISMNSPTFYFHVVDPSATAEKIAATAALLTQQESLRNLVLTPLKALIP